MYKPDTQQLFLYFAVPQTAPVFGLQRPAIAEIPLEVVVSTASATVAPSFAGVEASVDSLNIVLPPGLASSVHGSQIARADGQELPYWQKTPGHTEFTLEGYPLQGKSRQPQIYLYPALEYAQLVPGAFESMHRLRNVMNDPTSTSAEQLPAVPFFNDAQVFASNFQTISFQNGEGVRLLTEYAQSAASVNNHDLFYHFQGFTDDGTYYIVAIFPITAPMLAETSDAGAPLPAGGVPYPYFAEGPNADMKTYYASIIDLLNASPSEVFTPTLNQLDLLIQSIRITQ
jgi:hypothetical protein